MNAATNPAAAGPATARSGERPTDPSMEEILASIRRIIADDQAALQPPPPARVGPPPAPQVAQTEPAPVESPAPAVVPSEFEAWLAQTANLRPSLPENAASSYRHEQTPAPAYSAPVVALQTRAHETASHAPVVEHHAEPERAAAEAFVEQQEPVTPAAEHDAVHEQPARADPAQPPYEAEAAWHAPRLSVVPPAAAAPSSDEPQASADTELDAPLRPGFDTGELLSETAGSSVQSSFQALARTMFMQNTGMVEDAVRDMLRPMLKQWLDDNLPTVVERLVRAEIERVARGVR